MVRKSAGFVPKKAHRKSRAGCLTCKRKKVKCDEVQPICGYCAQRHQICEYPAETTKSPTPGQDLQSPGSTIIGYADFNDVALGSPTTLVPIVDSCIGPLTNLNLDLLNHFRTETWECFALRRDRRINHLYQEVVPQMSLSSSYALYALLSIAATHKNDLQPSRQMETYALMFRQRSFEAYTLALQNITAENYETVLVTSTLMMALVPPPTRGATDDAYLDWMNTLLKMNEGLRVLASLRWAQGIEKLAIYPLLSRELRTLPPPLIPNTPSPNPTLCTPLGPVGSTPDCPNPPSTYPSQIPMTAGNPIFLPPPLMELLGTVARPALTGPIDMHRHTLMSPLYALSPIFLSLFYYHLNPDFYVRVLVFPSFLMPDFLALVRAREPRALIVIAWWFALADLVPKGWWVGRCVSGVVRAVERVVEVKGNALERRAFVGAMRVVQSYEAAGREDSARCIFADWEGASWQDGPQLAAEWDRGGLSELDIDLTGDDKRRT